MAKEQNEATPAAAENRRRQSLRQFFERLNRGKPMMVDASDRRKVIAHWNEIVDSIASIRVTPHPGDRDARSKTLCRFRYVGQHEPGDKSYRQDEFRIDRNGDGTLALRTGQSLGVHEPIEMPLSGSDQISALVDLLKQHDSSQDADRQRRTAVTDLRLRCIESAFKKSSQVLGDVESVSVEKTDTGMTVMIHANDQKIAIRSSMDRFADLAASAESVLRDALSMSSHQLDVTITGASTD